MYFAFQRMQNIFCLIFKHHDYICIKNFFEVVVLFKEYKIFFVFYEILKYFLCIKAK